MNPHKNGAGLKDYRESLRERIKALKKKQENLPHQFKLACIGDPEREATYYSSWVDSALHILSTIPGYQTELAMAEFIHLPKTSPMNSVQNGNWRSRAVLRSQDNATENLHYTVVQSMSMTDFEAIKELLFDFLARYKRVADPSKEEEAYCLCLDFFQA